MKNFILMIPFLIVLSACKKDELTASGTIMRVNSYRQTCQGEGTFNCYLTQEGEQVGTDNWNLFYGEIEGFHHEVGFIYTLDVRKEKIENPMADASSLRYILIKIISKKKA